jgi:hypothetical protein
MPLDARKELALTLGCYGVAALALAGGVWIAAGSLPAAPASRAAGTTLQAACTVPVPCAGQAGSALTESR